MSEVTEVLLDEGIVNSFDPSRYGSIEFGHTTGFLAAATFGTGLAHP